MMRAKTKNSIVPNTDSSPPEEPSRRFVARGRGKACTYTYPDLRSLFFRRRPVPNKKGTGAPKGPRPLPRRYAVDSSQQRDPMSSHPVHRSIPPTTRGTVPTLFRFPNFPDLKPAIVEAGAPTSDPGPSFWAPTEVLVLHLGIGKECSLGVLSSAQGSGIKTVGVLAFTLQPYTKPNRGDTLHPNCWGHQEPEPPITGPRPGVPC